MGYPTIYPTGVTIYDKDAAWNGYTLFPTPKGALLIDMNGREVNRWAGLAGFPNKLLPGGSVFGSSGARGGSAAYQDQLDLLQVSWDGKVEWKWDHTELVHDEGREPRYMARQHHDFEREGSPTGYYAPGLDPKIDSGNTLILTHENSYHPEITNQLLIDDKIIEVTWEGEVVWEWRAADHFEEFGFSEAARKSLYANPAMRGEAGGDWLHVNCISTLGPNKWFDRGDLRFAPENILFDARNANILAIIDKQTGKIVWKLGPDFAENEAVKKIGPIIGQHHLHLIPRGLPGAGDLLVFDNGGAAGYDAPNAIAPDGVSAVHRDYSRVLEINPVTLEIVWQYTPVEAGFMPFSDGSKFYSSFISSAQRLENGNTLITEGSDGRLIEVTPDHRIVWEYISPYFKEFAPGFATNMVYRAYRAPYSWVPQVPKPEEESIVPIDVTTFRVPGAHDDVLKVTTVDGVDPNKQSLTGTDDDEFGGDGKSGGKGDSGKDGGDGKAGGAGFADGSAGSDQTDAAPDHADFCMVRLDKDDIKNLSAARKSDGGLFGKSGGPKITYTL
ncbi:thioredoxin [Bifidobacterium callitrichos]|uniref:Thioredoxin n=1 Tax=Bifidobacterium callitrichos TaxID=762209 RepID=A0A2T3G996_9BIFI|nr:aryl-sulfate sulfotransferase [Bifidobacterium callitrichos]PST46054.1 thioredoxin [Bifidobacterium callitrichos]